MATNHETWEDGLVLLFTEIGELPTCWRDQERAILTPDQEGECLLKVTNDASVGVDETRYVYNAGGLPSLQEIEPSQVGHRRTTLQVQVETYDQDAERRARHYLDRIRTRIRRRTSIDRLQVLDTSIISVGPIFVVDRTSDGRRFSLATMDIQLHTIVDERDIAAGSIDQIEMTGTFKDPAGNTVRTYAETIDLPDP